MHNRTSILFVVSPGNALKSLLVKHIHPLIPIPTGMAPDLTNMQRFSAFLFDVYGTLMISEASVKQLEGELKP